MGNVNLPTCKSQFPCALTCLHMTVVLMHAFNTILTSGVAFALACTMQIERFYNMSYIA